MPASHEAPLDDELELLDVPPVPELELLDVPPVPELLDVLDDAVAPPALTWPPPLPPVPLGGLPPPPPPQPDVDAASALDAKSTAKRNPNFRVMFLRSCPKRPTRRVLYP
jgi:hypothetical protein